MHSCDADDYPDSMYIQMSEDYLRENSPPDGRGNSLPDEGFHDGESTGTQVSSYDIEPGMFRLNIGDVVHQDDSKYNNTFRSYTERYLAKDKPLRKTYRLPQPKGIKLTGTQLRWKVSAKEGVLRIC